MLAMADAVALRAEVAALRAHERELDFERERLLAAAEVGRLQQENERLRELLGLREILATSAVAARITGAEASGLFRTATLNKGESDGVTEGFAVIAGGGVVGRVVATSPHASRR